MGMRRGGNLRASHAAAEARPGGRFSTRADRVADARGAMWTYVLRHRLLLRAIYARSTAA